MRISLVLALLAAPLMAQAQEAPAAPSAMAGMLPLVLVFAIFYFLMIRPQQRRFKEHAAMLQALKKGDEVVTNGGLIGVVTEADKNGVTTLEIAPGVTVKVTKTAISALAGNAAKPAAAKGKKAESPVKNDNVVLKKDQIANDN